jgi:lipopolysaccharide export system permease protein
VRNTLFGYVLRTYLRFAAGILFGLVMVFVVVDFVDRAKSYSGAGWVMDVAKLYGYKALVAVQQLGPAALLLAAGTAVSALRKQGEVTAIRALTFGPSALYVPVLVCSLLACLGLVAFDETVATHAGRRVDEITTQRFNRWGDWRMHYSPKQWFRRGDRIFFLRGGSAQEGFRDVSIFTVSQDFQLLKRLDAAEMHSVEGTRWRLSNVVERGFAGEGKTSVKQLETAEYDWAWRRPRSASAPGGRSRCGWRCCASRLTRAGRWDWRRGSSSSRCTTASPTRWRRCPRRCWAWGWRCEATAGGT